MPKSQRQDSLQDQLRDLIPIAEREGMYDAADHLRRQIHIEKRAEEIFRARYGGGDANT